MRYRGTLLLTACLLLSSAARASSESIPANPAIGPHSLADALLAFSDGVSAFREGDFESARKHFERTIRNAPRDGEAHYWLGLSLGRLGRLDQAEEALRRALTLDNTTTARSQIRTDLTTLRTARPDTPIALAAPAVGGDLAVVPSDDPITGRLSVGAVADSNPWRLSDGLILFLPDGTRLDGAEADVVSFADLRLSARSPSSGRWRPSLVGRLQHTLHSDFDQLDRSRVEVIAMLARGRTPTGYLAGPLGYTVTPNAATVRPARRHALLLQLGAIHERLDGESELTTLATAAGWQISTSRVTSTLVEALFARLDYENDVSGTFERSGEDVTVGLSQFFYLRRSSGAGRGAGESYLRFGIRAGDHQRGDAATRSSLEAAAEWVLPVGERLTFVLTGGIRRDEFDRPESNLFAPTGPPREDETVRAGGLLAWRLGEQLFLTLRGSWTDRDTELIVPFPVPELDYDRTQAAASLSWTF